MAVLESGIAPTEYGLYLFAGADSMIAHTGYSSTRARVYGNNNVYVYNLGATTLKYGMGTLFSVFPGMARSLVQVATPQTTTTSGEGYTTIIASQNGSNANVYYQQEEESTDGWILTTFVPNMNPEDMIANNGDPTLFVPILMGNIIANDFSRIVRNESIPPYNSWGDSDNGIPQTVPDIAQITDLELTIF